MSRTEQYNEARQNVEIARNAYNTASTKSARRDAAEELEFWMGKVATLGRMVAA